MIAALDMQLAQGTATGIGEYAMGLCQALRAAGADLRELREPALDPWRFDRRVFWDQVLLPLRARASGADVLHCLSGTMPLTSRLPCVVTVHDVAWLKVQAHARTYARYYFGNFSLKRYRRAEAIAVDSHFSERELLQVLDGSARRVRVIYPGVAADFCALRRAPEPQRMILVPGTLERRKNLETAIRAIARLPQVRLVAAGPLTPYAQECRTLARSLGADSRVEFTGYVSRERMLQLYAECALVAVPSRYEGFGYAAAQALCSGTPLLAADAGSLPEVVDGAAPVLPPGDAAAWCGEIEAILQSPQQAQARAGAVRAKFVERYSWDAAARATLAMYETAAGGS